MRSREIKVLLIWDHLLFDLVASIRKFNMVFNKYLQRALIHLGTVKSPWDTNIKGHGPCPYFLHSGNIFNFSKVKWIQIKFVLRNLLEFQDLPMWMNQWSNKSLFWHLWKLPSQIVTGVHNDFGRAKRTEEGFSWTELKTFWGSYALNHFQAIPNPIPVLPLPSIY